MARVVWFNEASQSASYLHELPTPQRLEVWRFLSLGTPSSWPQPRYPQRLEVWRFHSWELPIVSEITVCHTDRFDRRSYESQLLSRFTFSMRNFSTYSIWRSTTFQRRVQQPSQGRRCCNKGYIYIYIYIYMNIYIYIYVTI